MSDSCIGCFFVARAVRVSLRNTLADRPQRRSRVFAGRLDIDYCLQRELEHEGSDGLLVTSRFSSGEGNVSRMKMHRISFSLACAVHALAFF